MPFMKMARLIDTFESEIDYEFQRRQVPLEVDNLKMVVQFSDACVDCDALCGVKHKDLEGFYSKFRGLSKDEVAVALLVSGRDIMSLLSHMVPCVGCRKSVERLFVQLQKSQHPALEPLVITPRGELSVQHEYLFDSRSLFSLFHVHGSKLHSVVEAIPKSKKNKRCNLHSLETHKSKTLGCWLEAWDSLSDACKEEILVVDMARLLTTVESYLEKHKTHRFCSECKSKVLLAYNILVGDHDGATEKGFCDKLYEKLSRCDKKRHIHVLNNTDFIADLLEKAEPEFLGGKRDRHAKTLDIAQEEVLTCLGIHIFERLHLVWQKLRAEEQTWLILFYIGVDALRKSYQVALEEKQGASNLELLCEEIEEKEKRQEEKKEMKRMKKKQKKAKAQIVNVEKNDSCKMEVDVPLIDEIIDNCKCPSVGVKHEKNNNFQHSSIQNNKKSCGDVKSPIACKPVKSYTGTGGGGGDRGGTERSKGDGGGKKGDADDDSCESCGVVESHEGSEEGECSSSLTDSIDSCECDILRTSPKRNIGPQQNPKPFQQSLRPIQQNTGQFQQSTGLLDQCNSCQNSNSDKQKHPFQKSDQPSLESLLEDLGWEDGGEEEGVGISEEEILAFKAKQGEVESKRQVLRQTLRQRFAEFHRAQHVNSM